MEARKLAMISGLYANTNLDDGKNTRSKMINEIEEKFQDAIIELYEPQEKIDPIKDNPFFDAMNVPGSDIDWKEYAKHNPAKDRPGIAQIHIDDDIDQIGD